MEKEQGIGIGAEETGVLPLVQIPLVFPAITVIIHDPD